MTSNEIRQRFLDFFARREHVILPSAPLVPENDPSVLFNTAGMQPLVPYLLGQPHPQGVRLVNAQKCVRTVDIDDIGDNTHATFFEMLGNWSLGDYFKEEAIEWSYKFLTNEEEGLGLDPNRLYVTVFEGDDNAPRDLEAVEIWKKYIPENRIYFLGVKDNWWSPGDNGPCGPDTEMFYDLTPEGLGDLTHEQFVEANDTQKVVEIWNNVFMEYEKKEGKVIGKLAKKNVDTGSGLERITAVVQGKNNIFDIDVFEPIFAKIHELSNTSNTTAERIVADHLRTAVFLISDGVSPSNTDQGYILRRLIRRAVRYADSLGITGNLVDIVEVIQDKYKDIYPNVIEEKIKTIFQEEEVKFRSTLEKGLKEFDRGLDPFTLFTSYGFPFELTKELAKEKGIIIDEEAFKTQMKEHQDLSRAGAEQKFKGGLADHSEQTIKYHTATHLLNQALHDVLGDHVDQKGSNITTERLRFDFSHTAKMTPEEIAQVEQLVNDKIKADLPVQSVVLPKAEAEKTGARHAFADKYGDEVNIYFIGDTLESAYSKEFCGGPHVEHTGTLGVFKIVKEEAVAAGIRRIKAVLQ
ncbi:MAG: alanine--tRNA ligase [Candidatus Vogelbacteria bacterium]|nr:alanine--tRNA ligase [Candidatus Vogelbacteria bacterium]